MINQINFWKIVYYISMNDKKDKVIQIIFLYREKFTMEEFIE